MKLIYAAIYGIFSIVFLSMALVAYWLFFPVDILDVKKIEFGGSGVYHQGETVSAKMYYNKTKNLVAHVNKSLIKRNEPFKDMAVTIIASNRPGILPVGENQSAMIFFVVPVTAPPGRYTLHATARYQLNPLREVYEVWESPEFEVIPK